MTIQLPLLDPLDEKLKEHFATRVVRKSYAAQVHAFAKLPRFISEYLISLHADENGALPDDARDKIVADLEKFYPEKADKEQLKSLAMDLGSIDIIGHFEVVTDLRRHRYTTFVEGLSERATVDSFLVSPKHYSDLLRGGMWGKASFQYVPRGDIAFLNMNAFDSMQDQKPVLKKFIDARAKFSTSEWLDVIIKTAGLEPSSLDHETKMLYLVRIICLVERSYNMFEMGPPQTGKTHVFENLTSHSRVVLGGDITLAKLVYNLTTRENGIIFNFDVVCFDEINKPKSSMDDLVPKLQQVMASNKIERGDMYTTTDVSLVFQGNVFGFEQMGSKTVPRDAMTLKNVPKAMQDAAFLDRIHAYIHGWKFPRLSEGNINMKLGIISNYFSEIMHKLRKLDYSDIVDKHLHFFKKEKEGGQEPISLRDYVAVKKTIAGYIKILYPNKVITPAELQELATLAIQLRQNAIDQLKVYDPALHRSIGFEIKGIMEPTLSSSPVAAGMDAGDGQSIMLDSEPSMLPSPQSSPVAVSPSILAGTLTEETEVGQESPQLVTRSVDGLYKLGTIVTSKDDLLARPIPYWYFKLLVDADALELQAKGAKIKNKNAAGFTVVTEEIPPLRLESGGTIDFNILEDGLKDISDGIGTLKVATEDLGNVIHRISIARGNIKLATKEGKDDAVKLDRIQAAIEAKGHVNSISHVLDEVDQLDAEIDRVQKSAVISPNIIGMERRSLLLDTKAVSKHFQEKTTSLTLCVAKADVSIKPIEARWLPRTSNATLVHNGAKFKLFAFDLTNLFVSLRKKWVRENPDLLDIRGQIETELGKKLRGSVIKYTGESEIFFFVKKHLAHLQNHLPKGRGITWHVEDVVKGTNAQGDTDFVDTDIVLSTNMAIFIENYHNQITEFVLGSGDKDFYHLVKAAKHHHIPVKVLAIEAINLSRQLRELADDVALLY